MSYREHDVNSSAWSKVAEKIGFHKKTCMKNLLRIFSDKELKG